MKKRHEVTVSNIGSVIVTDDREQGERVFDQYMADSLNGLGRAAGESVHLWEDMIILREYPGP